MRYLQSEVSDVVDHTNPEERSIFRSLLAHLLSPGAMTSASSVSIPSKEVVEWEEPPKKRSRANVPEEVWTNVIDGEDGDTQHTPPGSILLTRSSDRKSVV